MGKIKKIILFFVAMLLALLASANRHEVPFVLNPFQSHQSVELVLPFFWYLFGSIIIGALAGGLIVWRSQNTWRQAARKNAREAKRWRHQEARVWVPEKQKKRLE